MRHSLRHAVMIAAAEKPTLGCPKRLTKPAVRSSSCRGTAVDRICGPSRLAPVPKTRLRKADTLQTSNSSGSIRRHGGCSLGSAHTRRSFPATIFHRLTLCQFHLSASQELTQRSVEIFMMPCTTLPYDKHVPSNCFQGFDTCRITFHIPCEFGDPVICI